ncbi:MAG: BglG family transcription antiterminator [Caldanaerobacter subterraneus]|nr:BglG family transcription antiterminator [Caldanaerobacter subterraneus]
MVKAMEDLSVRQKFILKNLIEKGPFEIADLANLMDVSERTVLREVALINERLRDFNVKIVEQGRKIFIEGEEEALKRVYSSLGAIPLQWLLTPDQRQVLMTLQLLLSDEPIKAGYFSYQFNVVEGTISLYLDKIEEWLRMRKLTLIRRRGYGIKVEGSEVDRRNAIIELFYNYTPMEDLLQFIYDEEKGKYFKAFFDSVFGKDLVRKVKSLCEKIKEAVYEELPDLNYFGMFVHILLSIYRSKEGKAIELDREFINDILQSEEFNFMKKVEKILEEEDFYLPESEIAYLAIHLSPKKYVYKQHRFEELGITLEELSKEVVEEVSRIFNVNIRCDEQLLLGLAQHLEPAFYRLRMGLVTSNPLIEEIKSYYKDLFSAVERACKIVFSKYNIIVPEEEIGYITMHIGAAIERQKEMAKKLKVLVICPNGIGTARILSAKLKNKFKEIDQLNIGTIWEFKRKHQEYDLIVSTIRLEEADSKVIIVSPFLTEEDEEKIRDYIQNLVEKVEQKGGQFEAKVKVEENFEVADEILRNFKIEEVEADSTERLIELIGQDLSKSMLAEDAEEIKELLLKREAMGNVVIPGTRIALLHTRSDKMVLPFLGVYKVKSPLRLQSVGFAYEEVDTFLVMLARKTEESDILEMLGKVSISLIEDKNFSEILRLGDVKDVRNALVKILNEA